MRFLLDQGVARSVVHGLTVAGHDALHVGACNLTTASDQEILEFATRDDRVIVTFDSDFSTLMAVSGASKPSIIHIRLEGMSSEFQTRLIVQVAQQYADALNQGAILSVQAHAVRMKSLPIR